MFLGTYLEVIKERADPCNVRFAEAKISHTSKDCLMLDSIEALFEIYTNDHRLFARVINVRDYVYSFP